MSMIRQSEGAGRMAKAGAIVLAMMFAPFHPAHADFYNGLLHFDLGEYEEAYREWKASADRGDAHSMHSLAELYRDGRGVKKDPVLALMYFSLASSIGHPEAEKAFSTLASTSSPDEVAAAIDKALVFEPKNKAQMLKQ